jgi:hypothetical protein
MSEGLMWVIIFYCIGCMLIWKKWVSNNGKKEEDKK